MEYARSKDQRAESSMLGEIQWMNSSVSQPVAMQCHVTSLQGSDKF